ncbi:MAG: GNAT family N-acetyltransferase [Actinomycetota bacterium]|nr:GNAT family N-acetyltransferase [Actinomycetota bacterium]
MALAGDLGPLLRLVERMDLAELGEMLTSEAEVRGLLSKPDQEAWVASLAGEIVAFGSLRKLQGTEEMRAVLACIPDAIDAAGLILDRLDAQARAAGSRELRLWQIADGIAAPALAARGWRPVRTYAHMTLELPGRAQLATPLEVVVRPAPDEPGLRLVHELVEETLAGHWDHRRRDFDEFYTAQMEGEGHDPALWYLAFVGQEPAGALIARIESRRGLIAWLGTRKLFRRRGVAVALLGASFHGLEERAASRVDVDVDTQNETNALHVYEHVGMRAQFQSTQWQLDLLN